MINLFFYRLLLYFFYPFVMLSLFGRKIRGKEDKIRFGERFGKTSLKRPSGKIIWVNAVSIGEVNSAWPIIKKILEKSNYYILLTSTTTTSSSIIANKVKELDNEDRIIHQYFPIDYPHVIKRFLNHWKPSILVNVENEIWPNLFSISKNFCPIFILNGKISKKSFQFWYKFKKLREEVFCNVDYCLAQTSMDMRRFLNLGIQRTQYLGNIKFFAGKLPIEEKYYDFLKDSLKGRKFWLANCTHEGEESIILETHKILKKKYDNLLTIILLRHATRNKEVAKLIKDYNLNMSLASKNETISQDCDIYLYDKIGNLGAILEVSEIVLMCGSLLKGIGGHNPVECTKHSCCIITGPFIENNKLLYKDLIENKGCIILSNTKSETIANTISNLFDNEILKHTFINNSFARSVRSLNLLNEIADKIISIVE